MKCLIKNNNLYLKNFKFTKNFIFQKLEWTHEKEKAYIFESGSEAYDVNRLLQEQGKKHCLVFMAEERDV